jgi:putative hydrolase of HD superfamily
MALVSCPDGINRDRCLQMCLAHDIAESLVGDMTPLSAVPREEKRRREGLVMDHIAERLGLAEVRALWREFEDGQTPEARFANDLDKLEMVLQAQEYERQHPDKDLGEFFGAANKVRTPRGQELAREIVGDRKIELSPEMQKLHDKYYG